MYPHPQQGYPQHGHGQWQPAPPSQDARRPRTWHIAVIVWAVTWFLNILLFAADAFDSPAALLVGIVQTAAIITALVSGWKRWRQLRAHRRDAALAVWFDRTFPPGAEHMCPLPQLQQVQHAAWAASQQVFADRMYWQTRSVQQCTAAADMFHRIAYRAQVSYQQRIGGVSNADFSRLDDDTVTVTPTNPAPETGGFDFDMDGDF